MHCSQVPVLIRSLILLWFFFLGWDSNLFAQFELVDEVQNEVVVQNRDNQFNLPENYFDQCVFQNAGSEANERKLLAEALKSRIHYIDQICSLTETQKKRLELAGQIETELFFEKVEVVREKFEKARLDRQEFNNVWQLISPLQTELSKGLYKHDSLLQKLVATTLDSSQLAKFEEDESERRLYRYRANVRVSVLMLEQSVPMTEEQRTKFVEVIMQNSKPPKFQGQYETYYVNCVLANLPEDKIQPVFDKGQWKILQNQVRQWKGYKSWLTQQGYEF